MTTSQHISLPESTFEMLLRSAEERGFRLGQERATSLPLSEASYGATQSAIVVFTTTSFLEARRFIRDRNFRTANDSPGQIYARSCTLLAVNHGDNAIDYICRVSSHWDI